MLGVRSILTGAASLSLAAALPTPTEGLALAFPGARSVRKEHILGEAQLQRVRSLAQVEPGSGWVVAYEAWAGDQFLGVAFFDTHRVRTLPETVLVAVEAGGHLRRVEVVSFREPLEYLPKAAWVRQLEGRGLDEELSLKRGIRPLSGATLSAHALVDAARRSLALFRILYAERP
ncbi:MAG: FMN-binding protein [Acidobacteria bacterium]|nr:FMN-binding protein [Acidobacteriota bacterium]